MNPFHTHLAEQVRAALRRGVAVVVDPAGAFRPFFDDLAGACAWSDEHPDVFEVDLGDGRARLVTFEGSWFAVRDAVEPFFAGDGPPDPPLLVYVPAELPEPARDVLMELQKAGRRLDWDFPRQARDCLRRRYTDGVIDEVLEGGRATYDDVVAFLAQRDGGEASRLKVIFGDAADSEILVRWLADEARDAEIAEKGAAAELYRLVASKVGLHLDDGLPLAQARGRLARYVLLGEFRMDLRAPPPASMSGQPAPETEAQREQVRELARRFRRDHAPAYAARARQVEQEFHLARAKVRAEDLGRIDTFEFEERLLLSWCAELLERGRFGEALEVVEDRERSFWVEWTDEATRVPRKEQWEVARRVAVLGLRIGAVKGSLPPTSAGPETWVAGYAAEDGWHRVDAAQRALETWRGRVGDESLFEKAISVVLRDAERLLHDMARGFTAALARAGWSVPGVLHQARVHPDVVATRGGPVAYFLVDALRYEMGVELARQLPGALDLHLLPAVAALPTITPVGMAALLPGASANLSVVAHKGKVAALVDGVPLSGVTERTRYLQARVPDVVDLTLSRVLQDKASELRRRVAGRSLVVVRSTEIDYLGETGDDHLARRAMEGVIGDLARAARRLSAAGVEHFVVTADHGHLFGLRKGDDMKTDAPGGDTVELHRRVWIGRGGATPPGTVRVSAGELGYAGDLELVFPAGLGVFKAGGDLSFHHGSTSLQELVIPVLSFRIPAGEPAPGTGGIEVVLAGLPERITNRVFVVEVEVKAPPLFAPEAVELRVVVLSEQQQVGAAGMVSGGELDRERGVLRVRPGAKAHVGLTLGGEDAASVKVVVLDPASGAVLASSPALPTSLLR